MIRILLSPRMLGLHLVAVLVVAATIWLGLWQYGAWQTDRQDQALGRADAPPAPLARVMSADAPFPGTAVGRPVDLAGVWLPHDTFYVSGKTLHGKTGYWVVTPVAVCGHHCAGDGTRSPAMLVVRGWTPRPAQAPPAPSGPVDVTGWLQPTEEPGTPDSGPRDSVLPTLSVAGVIQRFDQDLYGGFVIAKAHEPGLRPLTPAALPAPDTFTAVRNLLYAIEWWVFGGFAVFLWWRWCTDEVRGDRDDGGDRDEGEPNGGDTGHPASDAEPPRPGVASKT